MTNIKKTIVMLALIVLPAMMCAQITVTSTGARPTIKDFARAYCSKCETGSFEREALAALQKGNFQKGMITSTVDVKNGYFSYVNDTEGLEMCYWRCDNKNEILLGVIRSSSVMGFDETMLSFFRYNAKTKKMKEIAAPFDRMPQPADMLNRANATPQEVAMVTGARNEDASKFMPAFILPRVGKDITFGFADNTAISTHSQRKGAMIWNGSGFNIYLPEY